MKNKSTEELLKALNMVKNKNDLTTFIDENKENIDSIKFIEYIDSIISKKNLLKSEVIINSLIDRTYAYQVLNGSKNASRDKVIKLCLSCKMNIEETQRALTLSKNGNLYSKNKRDAIIMFSINKNLNVIDSNELLYEMMESILE